MTQRITVTQLWYKDVPDGEDIDKAKELLAVTVAGAKAVKELGWISGGSICDGVQTLE